jgi:hypothetical protein
MNAAPHENTVGVTLEQACRDNLVAAIVGGE